MTQLVNFVNADGKVSSKLVAEKFGKLHKNVLRDIQNLKKDLSNDFKQLNFEPKYISTLKTSKTEADEVLMTRDGFSILAMGFTGKSALAWKEKFLDAFNKMEQAITSELPRLRATITQLQSERLQLSASKKAHPLANTILVPIVEENVFGTSDVRYIRVPRNDDRYSEQSRIEGEIQRLSNLMEGMSRKIAKLSKTQTKERKK
jgi:Rha family phage regulatory protein